MKPWLLLFVLGSAFGQTSDVPYAQDSDGPGPTFTDEPVNGSYAGSFSSIRNTNFRHFKFLRFDKAGKPSGGYSLKSGHDRQNDGRGYSSTDLDSIHYLPASSVPGESALVLLSWFAAFDSSSSGRIAEVFTLSGGRLRVVQEINWDTHFQAGMPTESFDASTNTLVIRSVHYIPGDAHCCVSAMDVVSFQWDGTRFIQTGIRTELSEYGRKEGRSLPRVGAR
jgi:hypothetical protein